MSPWYTRKHGYGACEQPQQRLQQQQRNQQQPQLQLQPQQPDASTMAAENAEPKDWEERGTVLSLLQDVASVAWSRIFLLLTLVGSLSVRDSFMRCSQEETPGLKNYGEELMCHYTKAFIFTFPAMATSVLVLLVGRDFLQKRLYYGFLKNGGVITFSENKAYKDPLVVAMFVDFLHCTAYTLFHLLILHRQGQMHDVATQGFVPQVNTPESFLFAALRGGGPKFGGAKSAGARGTRTGAVDEDGRAGDYYLATVMMLVATFMEIVLLFTFIWYAYNITATLVPMSEYLNAYEHLEEEEQRFAIPRLHPLKDTAAKCILKDSHHIIPAVDGDLDKIYKSVVTKYKAHRHEIRGIDHDSFHSARSVEDPPPGGAAWSALQELSSIGLSRSLWPAELLMSREVQGHEAKMFQTTWLVYTSLALLALASVLFILGGEMVWELVILGSSRDWELVLPFCIMLVHALIVCIAIWSFVESVTPLTGQRPA